MSVEHEVVDKVFVINLDKDVDRMRNIKEQLDTQGIPFKRFAAVNGAELSESNHLTDFCNTACTHGIKGCALSHRAIWKEMVQQNYAYALILEDDAVLEPDFAAKFQEVWSEVPADVDLLFLGCLAQHGEPSTVSKALNIITGDVPEVIDTHVLKVRGTIGTHAYIISQACARKFLTEKIGTHIDLQMTLWIKGVGCKAYSSTPLLVKTSGGASDSNLADAHPKLLNSGLKQVQLTESVGLDTVVSEGHFRVGKYTVNILLIVLCIVVLLVPFPYLPLLGVWIGLEWAVSGDWASTEKFLVFLGAALAVRLVGRRLRRLVRL